MNTTKQIRFMIFARLPSYHELNAGQTWQQRMGRQRKFRQIFFWAIKEGFQLAGYHHPGNTSYFKEKIKVNLIIHGMWRRPPDRDNFIQSAGKLIIDQFFQTKTRFPAVYLLVDDSEKYLEWGDMSFKRGKPMVEITIKETGNGS